MEIYVLRHGEAEPRETGKADSERKLTAKGKRDIRDVAAAVGRTKAAPQLILTSPLRRARETAAVAAAMFHKCPVVVTERLLPSADAGSIWKEACGDPKISRVMLVGHEPHLGHTIAFLLEVAVSVNFKKGALIRIDTTARLGPPRGTLQWMITPRLSRAL